jgi:hypothetical protein
MRNSVNNRIELIGNEKIDWLVEEMIRRIEVAYASREQFHHDYKLLGEVFFGKSVDDKLTKEEIGSDWICLPEGYDSYDIEGLIFVSEGTPPYAFQDYILEHAAKLDPKVIVGMRYEHNYPNFIGARYITFHNEVIRQFEKKLETVNYKVVMDSEVDDLKIELAKDESDEIVISWDDLAELQEKLNKDALQDLQIFLKYNKST